MISSSLPKHLLSLSRRTPTTPRSTIRTHSFIPSCTDPLIVVGSGIAGCATALTAVMKYRIPVTLVHAGSSINDCNSYWAQGGIIYRNDDEESGDSEESLVRDVMRAGAGLCDEGAVRKVAREGPQRVRDLLLGVAKVPFDRDEMGELKFCLEASHSAPRIIHYADQSGKAITSHITRATSSHPLITVIPNTVVTDVILSSSTCIGIRTLHTPTSTTSHHLSSRGVVLSAGGLAGIYEHSTNPSGFNALGSSVSLASRAGATLRDLEYVQFHPTSLYAPGEARFLLTEALRGEGALLRDGDGRAFARDFHPMGELAPRDVVARGVFEQSQVRRRDGRHNAYLDISHREGSWLRQRFPGIDRHLTARGWDITRQPLPVVPAAHYTCGGVSTDLRGRTSVKGLYAAGEAARTGLHGGNRLASTSLLEGLVFGATIADEVGNERSLETRELAREAIVGYDVEEERWRAAVAATASSPARIEANKTAAQWLLTKLRRTMWDNVGVVRTTRSTKLAVETVKEIRKEACELFKESPLLETAGLRDAAYSGEAVAKAASENVVSAGAHYVVTADEADMVTMSSEEDSDEEEQDVQSPL